MVNNIPMWRRTTQNSSISMHNSFRNECWIGIKILKILRIKNTQKININKDIVWSPISLTIEILRIYFVR